MKWARHFDIIQPTPEPAYYTPTSSNSPFNVDGLSQKKWMVINSSQVSLGFPSSKGRCVQQHMAFSYEHRLGKQNGTHFSINIIRLEVDYSQSTYIRKTTKWNPIKLEYPKKNVCQQPGYGKNKSRKRRRRACFSVMYFIGRPKMAALTETSETSLQRTDTPCRCTCHTYES